MVRAAAAALLVLTVAGCPRVEVLDGAPDTETIEPTIRVGVAAPTGEISIGGGGALLLTAPNGGGLTIVPAGATATIASAGSLVMARIGGVAEAAVSSYLIRSVDSTGLVRLNNRDYRGEVAVSASTAGLLVVNSVALESYVAGVVNAEMGRRPAADSEAVAAQAVVSRTVAARALGRYRVRGYDLLSTIADQAYGGAGTETDLGWVAVRSTRGEVLTSNGAVIEAFFHSTCGGKTEAVEDVFSGGSQPFLRSVSDRDPNGAAYCAISPRFRWREEWDGEAAVRSLRDNGRATGAGTGGITSASDLQVSTRSPSGRATEMIVVSAGRAIPIAGQNAIRQSLRLSDGGWLRSTQFTLQVGRGGGRISRVVAEGGGNGHGVGMCQWGAVGRARAGFSYPDILSAYFPGAEIRRLY